MEPAFKLPAFLMTQSVSGVKVTVLLGDGDGEWVDFFSLTSCAPNYSDLEGLQLLLGDDEDLQPDRPVQQQHEVGTRFAASNSRIWGQPQIRVSLIFETAKQILICRMKIEFITKIIIFILTNVNYHADGDNNDDCDHNIYNFICI